MPNFYVFLVFFLFNAPYARMYWNQKDCFVPDITQAEEILKSASMKLHKWSKNMVNIENCNFLKVNWFFFLVIWVKWKQSVCSIILYSSTFYSLFLPFLALKICKFKYIYLASFLSNVLLPFPNSSDLNNCGSIVYYLFATISYHIII